MAGSVPQREQVEHFEGTGGIRHSPDSAWAREMAKWETNPREDGAVTRGMIQAMRQAGRHMGVFEFQEFPKALYRAEQTPNGIKIVEQIRVESEVEQRNYESRGFHPQQEGALGIVEAANQAVAVAAANRAYQDRRMSERAQQEAAAADAATSKHVGAVPVTPIKRRGRPAKPPVEGVS